MFDGLVSGIVTAVVVVALVALGIGWGFGYLAYGNDIVTTERIEPELRITVTEQSIDTVFVYHRK